MSARLVKVCKTFQLTNPPDWRDIKNRVEGVGYIDDRRTLMVFSEHGSKTLLMGSNLAPVIKTCWVCADGDFGEANHVDTGDRSVQALLGASGASIGVASQTCDYSVFRVPGSHMDVFGLRQLLLRRGYRAILDLEVHDALLLITEDKIVWSISDSEPQKILACVTGAAGEEAERLLQKNRQEIGLF